MESMRDQIVARIERLGEGKAFSAKDFLDIASRTTIDVTLAELARKDTEGQRAWTGESRISIAFHAVK